MSDKDLAEAKIKLALEANAKRAAETKADADERRERMRKALAGPKKRFGRT